MKWTFWRGSQAGERNECVCGGNNNTTTTALTKGEKTPDLYTTEGGEKDQPAEAPDGGWGWVVALGCFLVWAILGSASALFGILFANFLSESRTSSTVTAWIHNLAFVLSCYCTYLLDPLVEEYGWRRITFVMGLMRGLGLALSALAPSPYFLFFSYTIFAGIPIDVLYSLSFSIIPHYFTRRRTLANTFMSIGSSVSMLTFPLFVTFLQNHLGFKAAILITAAVNLNLCVAAMVFHPVEWHTKNRHHVTNHTPKLNMNIDTTTTITHKVYKSLQRVVDLAKSNFHLIKSPRVVIVSLVASINLLGLTNFDYLVPFAIQAAGHSLEQAGWCFTLAGICLLVTRLAHPFLVIVMTHKAIVICGSTILGTSVIGFAWAEDLLVKAAMMGAFGSGTGLVFASYNLVMVEVLGLAMLQPTLSITGLFNGALFLVIGPFIGFVRDMSGSYKVGMSVLGGLLYLSVVLWAFLPDADVTDDMKEQPKDKDELKHPEKQPHTPISPIVPYNERRPLLQRSLYLSLSRKP